MFKWRNIKKHFHSYDRKHGSNDSRRWLAISLLFIFILFTSLDPITTFSRYVVNRQKTFVLNTSNFFFTSSLAESELTLDDDGFTPVNILEVSNYEGININTDDISYIITLEENDPNPIFDLYTGIGTGGEEVKTICTDNIIGDTLDGDSSNINNYKLYLKLKDSATLEASRTITIKVTSSEPYIRSYNFNVIINKAATTDMIIIDGTDIERPNVPIPDGKIMVFKDGEYVLVDWGDLVGGEVVINSILNEGSLYIPESIGELAVGLGETINWDVQGNIIIEPNDIEINNGNISVTMLSRNGDIIINEITMTEGSAKPYVVNIIAENGSIEANETEITSNSKDDGNGKINLEAKNDININKAELESKGDEGINIQSTDGNINSEGANIESTKGKINLEAKNDINISDAELESKGDEGINIQSTDGNIDSEGANIESTKGKINLEAKNDININKAELESKVELTISADGDISAQSAEITNSENGKNITITSSNAAIDLSSSVVRSKKGNIYITAQEDIFIIAANIKASTSWGMELKFEATGSGSTLWVENATVKGYSINAYNLTGNGTLASGTIIYN